MSACSMKSKVTNRNSPTAAGFSDRIAEITRVLASSRRVLVASHEDPDGDAVGSQLAFASYLRHLGKEVFLVCANAIPEKYLFLPGAKDIPHAESLGEGFAVDTAVVLDCPVVDRTGAAARFLDSGVSIVNVDHHQDNSEFGEVAWVNTGASSVGEMVFEFFQQVGYPVSAETAWQLYTAILTDTGRFRFSSTTRRTMEIAGLLIEAGADPQKICDKVYYAKPSSTMKLEGMVLSSVEFHDNDRICFITMTREMLTQSGAHESEGEGLADFAMHGRDVRAGALLKEINDGRTKVSLRSRDSIDVAALAATLGGGGHGNASGCTMLMPLAQARQELLRLIREVVRG